MSQKLEERVEQNANNLHAVIQKLDRLEARLDALDKPHGVGCLPPGSFVSVPCSCSLKESAEALSRKRKRGIEALREEICWGSRGEGIYEILYDKGIRAEDLK
jgi:hypothetical protein